MSTETVSSFNVEVENTAVVLLPAVGSAAVAQTVCSSIAEVRSFVRDKTTCVINDMSKEIMADSG